MVFHPLRTHDKPFESLSKSQSLFQTQNRSKVLLLFYSRNEPKASLRQTSFYIQDPAKVAVISSILLRVK